jgi:acetyl esterase/lipase
MIVETDLVYGRAGGIDLHCDLYRPAAPGKRTAVVQLHGGGFARGSREMVAAACGLFAARGYLAVAAQYRLAGEAKWPAQVEDALACVRWLRASAAALAIDPAKIVFAGHSAGAYIALFATATAAAGPEGSEGATVAACIAYYPTERIDWRPGEFPVVMPEGSVEADFRRADVMPRLDASFPPTLLCHGTSDTLVDFAATTAYFDRLRGLGVPVEMHLVEGVSHEFDRTFPEFGAVCAEIADLFLDRHVVAPRAYPGFPPRPPQGAPPSR